MTPRPAFIVGQYKCGTSWLLAALSAHPKILGLREIDVIRAACADGGKRLEAAPPEHRRDRFFHRSAWANGTAYDEALAGEWVDRRVPAHKPQSIRDLDPDAIRSLTEAVTAPDADAREVLDSFLMATGAAADGERVLVLKAADQMAVYETLREWQPHAPTVAITRDGRDAALSARAYRKLMAKRDAPWLTGQRSYDELLEGWAGRAKILLDLAEAGEVLLIRYEDLTDDFGGTIASVLRLLGVADTPATIRAIRERTDFEKVTGRQRGQGAEAVMRKGIAGEWRVELDDDEKASAWKQHGEVLQRLGYRADGPHVPLDRTGWAQVANAEVPQ